MRGIGAVKNWLVAIIRDYSTLLPLDSHLPTHPHTTLQRLKKHPRHSHTSSETFYRMFERQNSVRAAFLRRFWPACEGSSRPAKIFLGLSRDRPSLIRLPHKVNPAPTFGQRFAHALATRQPRAEKQQTPHSHLPQPTHSPQPTRTHCVLHTLLAFVQLNGTLMQVV